LAAPWENQRGLWRLPLVEVTGGEPLLQPNSLPLMEKLCDAGYVTLLETSGSLDIAAVDPRVRRIVDIKCPASGEAGRNRWENLSCLKPADELKFVIVSHQDYVWAREQVISRRLAEICPVLFSWAAPLTASQQDASLKPLPPGHQVLSRQELAERILADGLPVRFQTQLHKIIWAPDQRGV
jgi:7-carboxy-7-deazaguanine synthase